MRAGDDARSAKAPIQASDGVPNNDLLMLTNADRLEAQRMADEITPGGGSIARRQKALTAPRSAAAVHNLISTDMGCYATAVYCLEQFYCYDDSGQARSGKV